MSVKGRILQIVLVFVFLGLCVVAGFLAWGYTLYQEVLGRVSITDTINEIRERDGFVPLEDLPEYYIDAVVAVEDHRFFEHGAIDLIAILRAVVENAREGRPAAGGSTITQQLAKNLFFTQEKVMSRKFAELFMAFDIESRYSKKEILEIYVNSIFFGSGHYGIKAASLGYYGVPPSEMTLYQATMLAGIPNAPSVYSLDKNPDLAKQRQGQVVKEMVRFGYLTQSEAEELLGSDFL